jgi:hypothetical protein
MASNMVSTSCELIMVITVKLIHSKVILALNESYELWYVQSLSKVFDIQS